MNITIDIKGPNGDPTYQDLDRSIQAVLRASHTANAADTVTLAGVIGILRGIQEQLNPNRADKSKPPLKLVGTAGNQTRSLFDEIVFSLRFDVTELTTTAAREMACSHFHESSVSLYLESAVSLYLAEIRRVHGIQMPSETFRYALSWDRARVELSYTGPAFPCVIEGENVWPIRKAAALAIPKRT